MAGSMDHGQVVKLTVSLNSCSMILLFFKNSAS